MWKNGFIGDVLVKIQNGINCKQDKSGVGNKITRIETIADAEINFEKTGFAQLSQVEMEKAQLEENDILFSHINSPIHVGKTALYRGEEPLWHGINLLRMKTIDDVDAGYFNYFLRLLFWSGYWKRTAKQSVNQASVNQNDIKSVPFSYPPLAEQQRIVAKLDAAFAEIDTAIKCNLKKYDEIDNLFNSFLGEKFNSEKFPLIKLSEVCDFIGGSQPPKSVFEYEGTASNVRLIQIRDYKSDKHIVYIPKDKARRFCSKNDVMIGRYGPPIFQILRGIEGSYNVALMKAVPKEIMLNDYLFYFLKNPKIQNFVIKQSIRAAGQSGVNKDALEPYQMHLPPISHQKEIVKKVSQFEDYILEVKNIYKAKLENLNALKSALLTKELRSEAA